MKGYDNLWGDSLEKGKLDLTDSVFDIMKQQCQYLKQKTNGRVLGKFSRIKKVTTPVAPSMTTALETFISKTGTMGVTEVMEEDDMVKRQNADVLYREQKYGFEIYNNIYRFRIFEVSISPVYPIKLLLDEEIEEEISDSLGSFYWNDQSGEYLQVKNEQALLKCLKLIFTSKKVRFILYRMLQNN